MAGATSQLLQQRAQTQERLKTYNAHLLQDILHEGTNLSQSLRDEVNRSSSAPADPRSLWCEGDPELAAMRERARTQRAIREEEMARREAHLRSTLQRRKEAEARRQDTVFASLFGDVMAGIAAKEAAAAADATGVGLGTTGRVRSGVGAGSSGSGAASPGGAAAADVAELMVDTDAALTHASKVRRNKKEALHQEWTSQVFDTIQGRLQAAVDERDPSAIEARLKSHYDAYLHTTNTKAGVFRDVIIEEDYNPMTANDSAIRIPTGDIRDPLKRDVLKAEYERRMMSAGSAGPGPGSLRSSSLGTIGKETLDPKSWGALAIGSTPYGHCVDRTGMYVVRPLSGSAMQLRSSRVPMDHYDYPVGNAAAAAEVPPGKRVVPGPEQRRGRQDLFDVVQHTCHAKPPGYTGGDRWLEHKGKAPAAGPEQRRGRRDLSDVLQQKALKEGSPQGAAAPATLGDTWLDQKGKARVVGPEERRGRQGLYETIHQSNNPYVTGNGVGDAWMEQKGRRVLPHLPGEAGAALRGAPPAPAPARVPDERKYGTQLGPVEGHFTVKV